MIWFLSERHVQLLPISRFARWPARGKLSSSFLPFLPLSSFFTLRLFNNKNWVYSNTVWYVSKTYIHLYDPPLLSLIRLSFSRFFRSFILDPILCIMFYYTLLRPAGDPRNFDAKLKEGRERFFSFSSILYPLVYWPDFWKWVKHVTRRGALSIKQRLKNVRECRSEWWFIWEELGREFEILQEGGREIKNEIVKYVVPPARMRALLLSFFSLFF